MPEEQHNIHFLYRLEISDRDIYEAMKDIPGYLDITPGDLKELFRIAYRHAVDRILSSVRAKDVMTKTVFAARPDMLLKDVALLMADHGISGVPVVDDDRKVIGVISEKDFLSRMGSQERGHIMGIIAECLTGRGCLAAPIRQKTAGDIMTSPAVTVAGDIALFTLMALFSERSINRAPVVDDAGRLIGIVSRADIIRSQTLDSGKN